MIDTLPAIPSIDDLTASAATLLQQALVEAQSDGVQLSATDIAIARSNQKAQAFVQGVGIHGAYRYVRDFVSKQAIPTKSSGQYLREWMIAYGIPMKESEPATGPIAGTGVVNAILSAGAVMQRENGLTYVVQADTVVAADNTVTPTLLCTTAGTAGNIPAGEKLTLVATEVDIDGDFIVGAAGINGGVDEETEAQAIYRLKQRLGNPPRGSAPSDYERWALKVPGITRAWGVRNPSGPTTAGVIIMADGNPNGLPTAAQRDAVYNYIRDNDRGPPDELFVIIPAAKYVDVMLGISPDTGTNRANIKLELQDLFYREALPGGRIPLSHLTEAVSIAPGEYTHQMFEPEPVPGGFLFSTAYEVLVLRNVEFQAMTNG
ncbi:baseplate J/gp47 family protein [Herbaspirillum lusitanum]|uniref:baseplate J/gp47 family protein n=1 Tax=Herbaspirillum lusitanum TaxID=213312 RepID=UPI002237DD5A|nr:baseplate J/gp47 family protein [Herbaspirillum lusitanum]MCW5300861.1 baseplate J/gp47 family protein [Herbaspirillum lusitanum]